MTAILEAVMRWSLVLLLPAIALAAPVPKAKEAAPPPFPTTVGDTRQYEHRTGNKVEDAHSDMVTKVEKQKDGSTHVTLSFSYPKVGASFDNVVAVSDTDITRYALREQMLVKPMLLLKLPATVGTKWEEGDSKFEVTAGKYKAVKVEQAYKGGKTVLWFAPGIGLVKSVPEGGDTALELKAFKTGK